MKAFAIAGLIAVCIAAPAAQQNKSDEYTLYGVGNVSCGTFAVASPDWKEIYAWWVFGFVSGAGRMAPGSMMAAPSDAAGLRAWVTKYCAEHPLDQFFKAAIALVDELRYRSAVVMTDPKGGAPPPLSSPTR